MFAARARADARRRRPTRHLADHQHRRRRRAFDADPHGHADAHATVPNLVRDSFARRHERRRALRRHRVDGRHRHRAQRPRATTPTATRNLPLRLRAAPHLPDHRHEDALKDAALSPIDPIEHRRAASSTSAPSSATTGATSSSPRTPTATPTRRSRRRTSTADANAAALKADGNTEIFIYAIPAVAAADLSAGAEVPPADLAAGRCTRVTFTPASRRAARRRRPTSRPSSPTTTAPPRSTTTAPSIAFVSSAQIGQRRRRVERRRQHGNLHLRTAPAPPSSQVTTRPTCPDATNPLGTLVFNDNPSLSARGAARSPSSRTPTSARPRRRPTRATAKSTSPASTARRASRRRLRQHHDGRRPRRAPASRASASTSSARAAASAATATSSSSRSTAVFNPDGTLNGALATTSASTSSNVARRHLHARRQRAPPTAQVVDVLRFPTFTGDSTRVVCTSTLNLRATNGDGARRRLGRRAEPGARRADLRVAATHAGHAATSRRQLSRLTNYQRLTRRPSGSSACSRSRPTLCADSASR